MATIPQTSTVLPALIIRCALLQTTELCWLHQSLQLWFGKIIALQITNTYGCKIIEFCARFDAFRQYFSALQFTLGHGLLNDKLFGGMLINIADKLHIKLENVRL